MWNDSGQTLVAVVCVVVAMFVLARHAIAAWRGISIGGCGGGCHGCGGKVNTPPKSSKFPLPVIEILSEQDRGQLP